MIIVSFEGIEGSGKSTQAKLLKENLEKLNFKVKLISEPGGTDLSNKIREILLFSEFKISNIAELMLFLASRAQLIEEIQNINLDFLILDRFIDSTVAYQGYGRGIDISEIMKLNDFVTKGMKPDITILLDIPVEEGLKRINKRKKTRIEKEDISFHKKVRYGYLELAKSDTERIKVINGNTKIEEIQKKIVNIVLEKFKIKSSQ